MLGISEQGKQGIWIATLVVAIIIIVLFVCYLTIVIWHFALTKKENKAKVEFNKLTNEIDVKNFNYLETLARKNDQLQKVIKLILEINTFYKNQLEELKLKLLDLSLVIDRYQLRRASKVLRQINKDVYKCKQLSIIIRTIYGNSTDYNLSASEILAKYRVAYNDIKDFYLSYLQESFKQKEFVNAIIKISEEITRADEFQTQLNNKDLITSMNNINELNKMFLRLVKLSHTYSYVIKYIVDMKKQLDDNLSANQKKLSKKELAEALRVSSHVKELIKSISKYLNELNFDSARVATRTATSQLEPAINLFKEYDRIVLLIDNGLGFAKISLDVIDKNIAELDHSFEVISKYFGNDNYDEMTNEINLIKASFKKIKINYYGLIKRKDQSESIDRISFLSDLFGLINNISDWEKSLNTLYQNIIHKYQASIDLLDKLYDLQWTLAQFVGLINDKVITIDQPTYVIVDAHLKTIKLIISKLNENYSSNFNSALDTVNNMEKDISNIYTLLEIESKIKDYAKSLIFYTNKYRLEDKEIASSLDKAEDLFKQSQYRKVIDLLLPVLNQIKRSAKASGYTFK